jgi:chromosome segregation ATPase
MELMASHEFQTALHNYLDLEVLRSKLAGWKTGLDAFDDMIRLRGANYEPLLPEVDAQFRDLDSRMRLRLEQKKNVGKRLHAMLTAPRPEYLATADERIAGERLTMIEKQSGGDPAIAARVAHLRGVLTFRLRTEYHERLTAAFKDLAALDADVDTLTRQYEDFVRSRQAATQSYTGYDVTIERLRRRVEEAAVGVDGLMARQGQMIETVAIHQLTARRERLAAQQTEARYAVADSYDRAARAQAGEEVK